jgi:hypothetical protein
MSCWNAQIFSDRASLGVGTWELEEMVRSKGFGVGYENMVKDEKAREIFLKDFLKMGGVGVLERNYGNAP